MTEAEKCFAKVQSRIQSGRNDKTGTTIKKVGEALSRMPKGAKLIVTPEIGPKIEYTSEGDESFIVESETLGGPMRIRVSAYVVATAFKDANACIQLQSE